LFLGGTYGNGTVFALNTDGTAFTNLHRFAATSGGSLPNLHNLDGINPQGDLILSGTTLYGTATYGGTNGNGTVFAINIDGTGFTNLHKFTPTAGTQGDYGTNSDGGYPVGGLIVSGNTLFGTTHMGGVNGSGTIFTLSFTPRLTLTPLGSDLVLTWPTNLVGFDFSSYTLQSTTNLFSPSWTANLPAPFVVDGRCMVTNPISGTHQFFRLRQ
jgi:uncharacterized repeat protein (TIGR03803 family)